MFSNMQQRGPYPPFSTACGDPDGDVGCRLRYLDQSTSERTMSLPVTLFFVTDAARHYALTGIISRGNHHGIVFHQLVIPLCANILLYTLRQGVSFS